ncbi:PEP-CTERM sorting domain-containing protein [Candidatus Desantisbacteria bacterium]|nr:PEP-CTERM sorting domain-containing protein [Candidatus Desantisbacteria bacterium]
MKLSHKICKIIIVISVLFYSSQAAFSAPVFWTDWISTTPSNYPSFIGNGIITTNTSTVNVTYTNPQGIAFFQAGGGTNYWGNSDVNSPYTSSLVDNRPTGTDIIGLQNAGNQTLQFSEAIANPVFSYVSLNGNGYAFDQDFDILSYGGLNGRDQGYWGAGTSYKNIVDLGGGNFEYQLLGTGEPHGTIRFTGEFDTVNWRSLSYEYWNGFTVGIQGTAIEVNGPVPEPSTFIILGCGLMALGVIRKKNINRI